MSVMNYFTDTDISELVGKTLIAVVNHDDEYISFHTDDQEFRLWHDQDCCEGVAVEDIVGDLNDLLSTPVLAAEESEHSGDDNDSSDWPEGVDREKEEYLESYTWTFYRLTTIKGSVVIRWFGSSNGYYSEAVTFSEILCEGT